MAEKKVSGKKPKEIKNLIEKEKEKVKADPQPEKIKSLTEAQIAKFPEYVKKWIALGINCDECDMKGSIEGAKLAYAAVGLKEPKYYLGPFNNPIESAYAETILQEVIDKYGDDPDKVNSELLQRVDKHFEDPNVDCRGLSVDNQVYGSMDVSWLGFYNFFLNEVGIKEVEKMNGLFKIAESCGWWTLYENAVLFQHRPKAIHFDNQNRTHNLNGPAIEFRGSPHCNVYMVHGVRVSKKVIDRNFTAKDIDAESNVEVRRIMIDLYGSAKYIIDSNAEVINKDDFGTLYKKEVPGDEAIYMVEVVNSTPEPDGSFKNYWIRVDPKAYGGVKTALAGVASTWRKKDGSMLFETPEQYDPDIET